MSERFSRSVISYFSFLFDWTRASTRETSFSYRCKLMPRRMAHVHPPGGKFFSARPTGFTPRDIPRLSVYDLHYAKLTSRKYGRTHVSGSCPDDSSGLIRPKLSRFFHGREKLTPAAVVNFTRSRPVGPVFFHTGSCVRRDYASGFMAGPINWKIYRRAKLLIPRHR